MLNEGNGRLMMLSAKTDAQRHANSLLAGSGSGSALNAAVIAMYGLVVLGKNACNTRQQRNDAD